MEDRELDGMAEEEVVEEKKKEEDVEALSLR